MNKIVSYLKAPVPTWVMLGAVGVNVASGVAITYFMQKRKYEATFQERLETEIAGTVKYYGTLLEKPSLEEVVEKSLKASNDEIIRDLNYNTIKTDDTYITAVDADGDVIFGPENLEGMTEVTRNVFTDADDFEWILEEEMEKRDTGRPYVIEHDEYVLSDYDTRTLTFYEGDGILADENDEHIPDTDTVVGDENFARFGHGSHDPNIVYIRNDNISVDFEVVRVETKYAEAVLGFIQHEDKRTPRKMRKERDY